MKPSDRSSGILICFTGVDGAGKTTLATWLTESLNRKGLGAEYRWCGWRQFESPLLGPIARVVKGLRSGSGRGAGALPHADCSAGETFRTVTEYLVLIDYLLLTAAKVEIPLMRGQILVCDRYVYDRLADLPPGRSNADTKKRVLMAFLHWLPTPRLVFLIDLPEEVAWARKNDMPSPEVLSPRRVRYLAMAEEHHMVVLDGRMGLDQLTSIIESRVAAVIQYEQSMPV